MSGLLQNRLTVDEFRQRWPDLLTVLAPLDPPAKLQVLLPLTCYERGLHIVQGLEELRSYHINYDMMSELVAGDGRPAADRQEDWTRRFNESTKHMAGLREILDSLEEDLHQAYLSTYE